MSGSVITSNEAAILDKLHSCNPRDYLDVATELANQEYDVQRLIELAIKQGVYNKVGFLAEMVYATLRESGVADDTETLQKVFSQKPRKAPLRHIVEKFPLFEHHTGKTPIHRKWRIATSLDEKELSDVLQYRIGLS